MIVGQTVIQSSNDRGALPELAVRPGEIGHLVADQGYYHQAHISQVKEKLDTTVISVAKLDDAAQGPRAPGSVSPGD